MQNPFTFWVADIHRWEQIDLSERESAIGKTDNRARLTERILVHVGDLMIVAGENLRARYSSDN